MKVILIKIYIQIIKIFGLYSLNEKIYKLSLHPLGYNNEGSFNYSGEEIMIKLLNLQGCNNLFIDIGGYKGEYSKMILKNTNCNVLLYEPQKKHINNFNNLKEKWRKRFNYKNIAISDFKGSTKIFYKYKGSGMAFISNENLDQNYSYDKVKVDFIDDLHATSGKIDGIKIDVEGKELSVLLGAKKVIKENYVKFIQIEFNMLQKKNEITLNNFTDILDEFNPYRVLPYNLGLHKINLESEYDSNYIHQNIIFINRTIIPGLKKKMKFYN